MHLSVAWAVIREAIKPAGLGIALEFLIEARGIERLEPVAEFRELVGREFGDSLFEVFDGHKRNALAALAPQDDGADANVAAKSPGFLISISTNAIGLSPPFMTSCSMPAGR